MAAWIAVGLLLVLVVIVLVSIVLVGIRKIDRRLRAMTGSGLATYDHVKQARDDLRLRIDRTLPRSGGGAGGKKPSPEATVIKDWVDHVGAAEPREVVTFGICLAGALSVADWKHTCGLLSGTLRSVLRQSDPRFRVVICGHDAPEIPELDDDRVAFLRLAFPPPMNRGKFRADKSRKRINLGRKLREVGGGYYMQLDADDLLDRDLVATILQSSHPHGFIFGDGYALDWSAQRVAPTRKVWPFGLDRVCGSTSVVFLPPDDLPGPEDNSEQPDLLFNMLRAHPHVKATMSEMGRTLRSYDGPAVAYVVNHSQNLSFQMQKSGTRGHTIVDRVARHAITDPDALAAFDRQFGTRLGLTELPALDGVNAAG